MTEQDRLNILRRAVAQAATDLQRLFYACGVIQKEADIIHQALLTAEPPQEVDEPQDTGFALAEELRKDANECLNPVRSQLMEKAADEIEKLIMEIRQKKAG